MTEKKDAETVERELLYSMNGGKKKGVKMKKQQSKRRGIKSTETQLEKTERSTRTRKAKTIWSLSQKERSKGRRRAT